MPGQRFGLQAHVQTVLQILSRLTESERGALIDYYGRHAAAADVCQTHGLSEAAFDRLKRHIRNQFQGAQRGTGNR